MWIRILGIGLILMTTLVLMTPEMVGADPEDNRFIVAPTLLPVDFEGNGTRYSMLPLQISNKLDVLTTYTVEITQYRNYTLEEIMEGKEYADPTWVSALPESIMVPPGQKGVINVITEIPEFVEDGYYSTYVKVSDGVDDMYVMVRIRIGSGIPIFKYAIEPGYFHLSASGEGDRTTEELAVTVYNTGTGKGMYRGYGRLADDPENIDPEYTQGSASWVTPIDDTIEVSPGEQGDFRFKVVLPDNVADGRYKVWLGVRDLNQEGAVQVEYACKLLLDVNYDDRPLWKRLPFSPWKVGATVGGGVVFLGGLLWFLRRERIQPEPQEPNEARPGSWWS